MKEYTICEITIDEFNEFYELMEEAFPTIERRSYENQKKLFENKKYKVLGCKDKSKTLIGFLAYWEFEKFNFIEHFAVGNEYRGSGIGSILLDYIFKLNDKEIILEVELPENKESINRIKFYEKRGFKLNMNDYMQPPLEKGNELLPLKIMSYKNHIGETNFNDRVEKIYKEVYGYSL